MPISDSIDNIEEFFVQGGNLIEFYRNDPVMAAYDLLRIDLAPIQRAVLRDMWFKSYCIVVAGRGLGKTFLQGVNAVLHALLYPGYRVGLLGPSFRQCLVIDDNDHSVFWTNTGMKSNALEFYDSIDNQITETQSLYSQNRIVNKWKNIDRPCRYIKTTNGLELSGAIDHNIMVLGDNFDLVFKELGFITNEDSIVIRSGFNYFGNNDDINIDIDITHSKLNKLPQKLTTDLSYFLGLLCGDGYIESDTVCKKQYVTGFCSADLELLDRYKSILSNIFEYKFVKSDIKQRTGKATSIDISNKSLHTFLKLCGMTNSTSSEKVFPHIVKKASKNNMISFLRGLYDTDGCCYVINNDKYKSCTIEYVSTSKRLCKELQAALLNLGIISSFSIKSDKLTTRFNNGHMCACKIIYKVRINGTDNLKTFNNVVGFGLSRKQHKLDTYLSSLLKIDYNNTIPNSYTIVSELAKKCRMVCNDSIIDICLHKYKRWKRSNFCVSHIKDLLKCAEKNKVLSDEYYKLRAIVDYNISFVKMDYSNYFVAPTMDIEVENEHCYWAAGFINHNSKMIFSEVEKLYNKSPILREATLKRPVRGADSCSLTFKNTETSNGSFIEALPIGVDGAKIRGSRFYLIAIDELAQMPPDIIDLVLRPMAVVVSEPMQKVREIERIERLMEKGLATEEDLLNTESANKMIMTSSGYFKFNHMWHRMKSYWKAIKEQGDKTEYGVWQIPYQLLPKGFLDMKNVNEAKRTMSNLEFMMEYEAAMASDSEGFFKASLLEYCTRDSGYSVLAHGVSEKEYILGIDPNQGGSALFGMVVIELGSPNKIVYARGLKKQTTQDMTKSVQKALNSFNIKRIYMDAQGGGNAIKDLLAEGYNNQTPILDMDDDTTKFKQHGKRILRLINFSPAWIADANFATLALLENNRLKFPELPINGSEIDERLYEDIKLLKSQMLNIVVTETSRGIRHFDTPKKGQNKDLYSAVILAAYGANELTKSQGDVELKLEPEGLVRPHTPGSSFVAHKYIGSGRDNLHGAVLQRRI